MPNRFMRHICTLRALVLRDVTIRAEFGLDTLVGCGDPCDGSRIVCAHCASIDRREGALQSEKGHDMTFMRRGLKRTALVAGGLGLALLATGCSGGGSAGGSNQTKGVTITVAWLNPPPPKAALAQFTKEPGIHVKWTTSD